MINAGTGHIVFDDGLAIFPGMTTNDLSAAITSDKQRIEIDGRRSFRLGTHQLNGERWGLAVLFSDRLDEVWMQHLSDSLPDWNMETEKRRHQLHIDFLKAMFSVIDMNINPSGRASIALPWGELSCELDLRGVQAIFRIKYR